MSAVAQTNVEGERQDWEKDLRRYQRSDPRKSVAQLLTTLLAYVVVVGAMGLLVAADVFYGVVLLIAFLAAGLLIRIFIFFHDACHRSFFGANWANTLVGYLCGTLVFTPYSAWRSSHLRHHTTMGDLDRRGHGDVWTMTLEEYREASWTKRVAYRVFRHPLVMLTIGPVLSFVLFQRLPSKNMDRDDLLSVVITDLLLVGIVVLATVTVGWRTYVAVQLPVIALATTFGVWMFYVQHQYQGVYWARHEDWNARRAALEGASYYRMPGVLRWFTGSIGYHHIHHLRPRVPNYYLREIYEATPQLQNVTTVNLRSSLDSLAMRLYEERTGRMVGFDAVVRE